MPIAIPPSLSSAAAPRSTKRRTPIGKWRLVGDVLIPKKSILLTYCTKISKLAPEDPLLTFHFPSVSQTVTIHKSRLTMAGGPLCALVNNGFSESTQRDINLSRQDSPQTFSVLRAFLYLQPIDLSKDGTVDLALAAHRWALGDLFHAFFVHARLSGAGSSVENLLNFIPLLRRITVPYRFRIYLAVNVALNFSKFVGTVKGAVSENRADSFQIPAGDQTASRDKQNCVDMSETDAKIYPGQQQCPGISAHPQGKPCMPSVPSDNGQARPSISANAGSSTAKPVKASCKSHCKASESIIAQQARAEPGQGCGKRNLSEQDGKEGKEEPSVKRRKCSEEGNGKQEIQSEKAEVPVLQSLRMKNIWEIFQSQGMLSHVLHYVSRFSKGEHSSLFLDVILRQLEPKLKDSEVISLLRHLDWECVGHARALRKAAVSQWSTRALGLLAVAQASLLSRGEAELKLTWTFGNIAKHVHERNNVMIKSENFAYEQQKFYLSAGCSDCSPGYLAPLMIRVVFVPNPEAPMPKNILVWARVRAIEDGCGCDVALPAPRRPYRGMNGHRVRSPSTELIPLTTFAEGSGEPFILLDSGDFRQWLNTHKFSCALVVQVQLRFRRVDAEYEAQRNKSDFGLNAQQRALMRARMLNSCRRQHLPCRCGLHHAPVETDEEEESDEHESESEVGSDVDLHFGDDSDDGGSFNFFADY